MFYVLLLLALPSLAFDNEDYKKYVNEVKKEVWSQNLPQFNNRTVPDKYKKESAVIMAYYEEFMVDQKKKINIFYSTTGTVKELNATHLRRSLIKINDKAALDRFSTFDYQTYERYYNYGLGRDDHRMVLGVRVIKPNGKIEEVNNDDYQDVTEGKDGKEKRAKLAVPNLQIGDIIEYFTYNMDKVKEENIAPQTFFIGADFPILDYQIHCNIDKKLCTQYRIFNGAPDFQAGTDEDGNVVLDLRTKNIDRTLPNYAYNAAAQAPYISLYTTGKVDFSYVPKSTKDKGLHANPDADIIQNDAWNLWAHTKWFLVMDDNLKKAVKKAKEMNSDEEKADYLYNFAVMSTLATHELYLTDDDFAHYFRNLLKRVDVSADCMLTTDWTNEPIDQLINYNNVTRGVVLKSGKVYMPLRYATGANTVPSLYQNRKATKADEPTKYKKGATSEFIIPGSKASDNVEKVDADITIEGNMLNISRTETLTGTEKESIIYAYASAEDISKTWGINYDIHSFAELLDMKRNKAEEQAKERATSDKENIVKNFLAEIKNYHDKVPTKINSTAVTDYGNNGPFAYNVAYQMDGMVKKAGRNIVVSIGQLVGQQTHIEGKERNRTEDLFYAAPRCYEVTLTLAIPQGYSVATESLQKLSNAVDNDAVSLHTSATTANGKVIVKFQKVYKQQIVKVDKWHQVLNMLDRAYDFKSQQLILRLQ